LSDAVVEIPKAFRELFVPSRYKAYYGGRGSAKSHSFAGALIIKAASTPLRVICAREIQNSIDDSVKQLLDDKIALGVPGFRSTDKYIEHRCGSVFTFAGLRTNPDKVKSKEGYDIAWVEEANRVTRRSIDLLIPTLREEGSELWFSWNPEHDHDPVDVMFRGNGLTPEKKALWRAPPDSIIREVSWRDNPYFPDVLRKEMAFARDTDADKHEHVWEGGYAKAIEGAYYQADLLKARREGRVRSLAYDPMRALYAHWDIGVEDHTTIWLSQRPGADIHYIDYIEGQGQALGYYLNELRSRGYERAICVLPHDGAKRDAITAYPYVKHVKEGGFANVRVIPNQGKGAAKLRIEAARRIFPRMHFDEDRCGAGLKALGAYHEKMDENRKVGLGPAHDWASDGADAFGLSAVDYKEPEAATAPGPDPRDAREGGGDGGWMRG
jgi:phage terminase large subunit